MLLPNLKLDPYVLELAARSNEGQTALKNAAMQAEAERKRMFDLMRQNASQPLPEIPVPQEAQLDPRAAQFAGGLTLAGIFGGARPQYTQNAVQNILGADQQRKQVADIRNRETANRQTVQNERQYDQNQNISQINVEESKARLADLMRSQQSAQGQVDYNRKVIDDRNKAVQDQKFKLELQDQKFARQGGLEQVKGAVKASLAKYTDPVERKKRLGELMREMKGYVDSGALDPESFRLMFADEISALAGADLKGAQQKRLLELLPDEKRLMGARASYYEQLPGILQDRMDVDQWKAMLAAETRMNEGLAAGPEGVKALEDASKMILDSLTSARKKLTDLRSEQTQLDPKDADGKKAYAEAIAKTQNEIRDLETKYNQSKERVADAKKPRPASPVFDPTTLPQFKGLQPGPPSLSGPTGR